MSKKVTLYEFIKKAKKIHGDKYDYSKVEYVNSQTKVCIICPEHGEFWQIPSNHLHGNGCPKCSKPNLNLNTEEFIKKARKIHGDKYDYSKAIITTLKNKVCIICHEKDIFGNEHGEFFQKPLQHLQKIGCPKCCKNKKITTEEFIEKAKKLHGDKYDYSKVEYVGANTKVCIICPEHGEFWQKPYLHLQGQGCSKCHGFNRTTEEFIKKAIEVHGDKYDYSKTIYNGSHSKLIVICPEHGEFQQTAKEHLKYGCKKCANKILGEKVRLNTEEFIRRAKGVHGNKYDYSKVEYINTDVPVCIICPEHGEFWQTPHIHLSKKIHGCPFCAIEQNVNEELLYNKLMKYYKNKYTIIRQKKFSWLKNKKKLTLDFYIEELKVGIEYQGLQHYTDVAFFGDKYQYQHNNDLIKINLCKKNNIKLYHFSFDKKVKNYNTEYETICDFDELINKINNE